MDAREEIKSRLAVEDVVGWYLEVKRAGRNLKALSPFTSERTPSLMISPDKQMWYDFSSNQGGDIFTFVMKIEGFSFPEALEFLAGKAGVDLAKYGRATGGKELTEKRLRLLNCLKMATKYFQIVMTKTPAAMDYVFYKRNMNRATVQDFKIGYASDEKDGLKKFLLGKGFAEETLREAGLLNRFGGDLFRERMMISLMDGSGEVIGYTGRTIAVVSELDKKLGKNEGPKYLNTPATLLYDKTRHIFGLSQAKTAIRESGFCVIVEGNMDVISSHQAGYRMAVATAGTAMTKQHLSSLAKLTTDIRLAYDGDKAGREATERAVEIASEIGLSLTIVDDYMGAKDADELIQRGAALWGEAIAHPKPAVEWILEKYKAGLDLKSPVGKKNYSDVATRLIEKLQDPVEKEHYMKLVAHEIDASTDAMSKKMAMVSGKAASRVRRPRLQDHLEKMSKITDLELLSVIRQMMSVLIIFYNLGEKLDNSENKAYNELNVLRFGGENRYGNFEKEDLEIEFRNLVQKAKLITAKNHQKDWQNLLKIAEERGDVAMTGEILGKLNNLMRSKNGER
ncbi:MAG: DNA primase [Candidatus Nomurabacteria bacterium]|jgi:DNA primase|nr:DNA primase [Candidatus Nomurabacteria bacterium]